MSPTASLSNCPKGYNNIDGTGELGIGFMCLSFAVLQWMQIHSPEHSAWNRTYVLMIYMLVMCSVIHYGTKAIKKRLTYPRTGFVEYRKRDTVWIPAILGAGASAVISVVLGLAIRSHWHLTTPAPLVGLIFAASYAHGIARTVRWKWTIVVVMTCASLLLAVLPASVVGAVAEHSWITRLFPATTVGAFMISMGLYGAVLLISGGVSFSLYLRNTKTPAQEEA